MLLLGRRRMTWTWRSRLQLARAQRDRVRLGPHPVGTSCLAAWSNLCVWPVGGGVATSKESSRDVGVSLHAHRTLQGEKEGADRVGKGVEGRG